MTPPIFPLLFTPHWLVRNAHLQTVFSSLKKAPGPTLHQASRPMILESDVGVRLQGFYAAQPAGRPVRGVLFMMHGWLGCANANYLIDSGETLYRRGFNIFRLNFRDHGDTHRLNPGPFRSDRLDEVADAARQVAAMTPGEPLHIVGASLGGNFALRLAWHFNQANQTALPELGQTIAICPAIDPAKSTQALDDNPVYLRYFRRRWRDAFQRKQAAFPGRLNFEPEIRAATGMEMTEHFIHNHSPYASAQEYFEQYRVTPKMLSSLRRPVTIITAADDPIIPAEDFEQFRGLSSQLTVSVQPYGGHVGFIDLFPYRHWLNRAITTLLAA